MSSCNNSDLLSGSHSTYIHLSYAAGAAASGGSAGVRHDPRFRNLLGRLASEKATQARAETDFGEVAVIKQL